MSAKPKAEEKFRINATLAGHYASIWEEEKSKGGADGEVLRRFMERSEARSLQTARHEVYNHLNAQKLAVQKMLTLARDPETRADLLAIDAAADKVRRVVSQLSAF